MKKILSFLAILALLSNSTTNLVSCSSSNSVKDPIWEYRINYTFKPTTTYFNYSADFSINYNIGSSKRLYLENRDQIEIIWNWAEEHDGSRQLIFKRTVTMSFFALRFASKLRNIRASV